MRFNSDKQQGGNYFYGGLLSFDFISPLKREKRVSQKFPVDSLGPFGKFFFKKVVGAFGGF